MRKEQTKKLAVLSMLCALAYIIVAFVRIPAILFLKYEPKDVVITIGGFLYGPLASFAMSVVVSFIEMVTISDTGWIGFAMNVLSTCGFACTAAFIYKKNHTLFGAVIGLIVGALTMTALMVLWNYALTPIYMKTPRSQVATMLLPVFLPFNLVKGGLNAAITALLYRPLVQSLRRAGLFPQSQRISKHSSRQTLVFYIVAALVLAAGIAMILWFNLK
ncbi:MAG: ECF transporter S component [Ruminococcaceae bacterium]|nr:ECF transporter S component [Oscillospiraceae bacterium]